MQWSNADIEFPSTSTSDEIEIISQPDDETICKLLSALPMPHEATEHSTKNDDIEKCTTDLQSSSDNPVFPVNFAVSENLALGKLVSGFVCMKHYTHLKLNAMLSKNEMKQNEKLKKNDVKEIALLSNGLPFGLVDIKQHILHDSSILIQFTKIENKIIPNVHNPFECMLEETD